MDRADRRFAGRPWPALTAVVVAGAVLNGLLAVPIRRPRIFGDELIYWELARAFAWTGHFTVRGGSAPRYGIVYPALVAVAQRLGTDQHSAYAIAQGLNAVLFALAAVPTYAIATRVLSRRGALAASALAVILPSCIYTSNIYTENAFYPLFLTGAWLMVRALERPSTTRQLLVAAACAVAFLTRAQAVVLLPSYLAAALIMAVALSNGRRRPALARALREHAPTIAVLVLAGIAAIVVRGRSTLGPYHVLVSSYNLQPLAHWALANVADIDLYVGVVPLAAFLVLLLSSDVSTPLRRLVVLTACLGTGLIVTVAVLGASAYGLGRVHERNVFYVVPLVLIAFLAWLREGLPRPRRIAIAAAVVVALLPLTIPRPAVLISGEDGIATIPWADLGIAAGYAVVAMAVVAAVAAMVFLRARSWKAPVALCLLALVSVTVLAERHAVDSLHVARGQWRDDGWIDRAVGADAQVVELWATVHSGRQALRIGGAWADEFFNRSVRDVASADGPLPDGLPIKLMTIAKDGCLRVKLRFHPQYAVLETIRPLTAPVVAVSPSGRAVLYRLDPRGRCIARLAPGRG